MNMVKMKIYKTDSLQSAWSVCEAVLVSRLETEVTNFYFYFLLKTAGLGPQTNGIRTKPETFKPVGYTFQTNPIFQTHTPQWKNSPANLNAKI